MSSNKPYVAPEHLFFLKMTARSARVGDILKTRWGLREVLGLSSEDGHITVIYRDAKACMGGYSTVEVLVQ